MIYSVWDDTFESMLGNHGTHINGNCTMINYMSTSKIISTTNNNVNIIEHIETTNDGKHISQQVGRSYFHIENLHQYTNNTWNIRWSTKDHHLYDTYTDKLVRLIITCHKYGKLKQWIPKPILLVILSFIIR